VINYKVKGWIYAVIQFLLIAAMLYACLAEANFILPAVYLQNGIGILIALLGLIMFILSFISFGQVVTPNPVPLEKYTLKTSGMYKHIRHPIYSSVLIMWLGVVIYFSSVSALLLWFIGVVFITFKIRFEESLLRQKFSDYNSYSEKTKKLIPFIY
jgi:protein-S-isoprenylcysteine O-methyltransferase Ste14